MRARLSPAAKLVAAIGVLLSLATSQSDYGAVEARTPLGAIAVEPGGCLYLAGTAAANSALRARMEGNPRLSIHIPQSGPAAEGTEWQLWQVEGRPEGTACTAGGQPIGPVIRHGELGLDVGLPPSGTFHYVLEVKSGTLAGALTVEAQATLNEEATGQEAIALTIDAFEVLP